MTPSLSRSDAAFAVLAGLTGVASSFAVAGYTSRFVVAPIDAFVVRLTPAAVVSWMIVNVGEAAHLLHIALSIAVAVGSLAGACLVGLSLAGRLDRAVVGAGVAGVLAWGFTTAVTAEPVLALGAAVPVALVSAVGATPYTRDGHDPARRRALFTGASALAFVGVAAGLGWMRSRSSAGADSGGAESTVGVSDEVGQFLQLAADQSLDVAAADLPGLVTPIGEFYNVDINQFDPELSADGWSLTLTGEVESDVTVTFEELTDLPVEHRFVTLRCVGERLNGHKMDTAVWTGTPIGPLLKRADPNGECGCAMLRAEDGYYVQFPLDALEDAFLVWGMNGQPLPTSHGHPVRVLVPGHWGETNVKWLSEVQLLDEEMDGYWERRGWHGTGPVNTVAKLWADTRLADGRVEVAGHAYAGTRGIERVEVSTDGGDTWQDAELSDPLPGDDVWRQWRYVFGTEGPSEVVVRAIDGEGTVQPRERSNSFPSGATGWVTETVGT